MIVFDTDVISVMMKRGTPVSEPDLRIASICIAAGATLATGNVRHFDRVPGLSVEDWLAS